jgi:hypothetical protein
MSLVSDIKLIRTDTTLDLSQKAEKGIPCLSIPGLLVPRLRPALFPVSMGHNPRLPYTTLRIILAGIDEFTTCDSSTDLFSMATSYCLNGPCLMHKTFTCTPEFPLQTSSEHLVEAFWNDEMKRNPLQQCFKVSTWNPFYDECT